MRYLLFLALSHCLISATAQGLSRESKAFIEAFFKSPDTSMPFVYTKGISADMQKEIAGELRKQDTLRKLKRVGEAITKEDIFVFTPAEKNYIITELQKLNDTILWSDFAIKRSVALPNDSIKSIFEDKDRNWAYFNSRYGNMYFSFSIPVLFRNNSFCFFYYEYHCGAKCASGILGIYQWEEGKWKLQFIISEWIS